MIFRIVGNKSIDIVSRCMKKTYEYLSIVDTKRTLLDESLMLLAPPISKYQSVIY